MFIKMGTLLKSNMKYTTIYDSMQWCMKILSVIEVIYDNIWRSFQTLIAIMGIFPQKMQNGNHQHLSFKT